MKEFFDNIFNKSEFVNKVLGGTILLTLGTVIAKLIMAGAYIVLARIFSPDEYGEYSMISSTINNFLIFASLGIGLTTTKYISENKNESPEIASGILGTSLTTVLILGLITGGIFIIFSDFIAITILKSATLKPLLKYGAIILMITALNSTQIGALLGLQSYKSTAIANILQGLFVSSGLIIGGLIDGVRGAVIGNMIAIICLSLCIQILLRNENRKFSIKPTLVRFKDDLRTIYKFALPASLSSLIVSPAMWILNTMLARTPDGYTQLGIYSAVLLFPGAIQMINGSLNSVLLPIFLSKETEITAKKEFLNYYGAWIITIVLAVPLLMFPELITFVIGDKYNSNTVRTLFGIIMISTFVIAIKQGISRDLVIKNKMWLSVFSMGQWAITVIVLFFLLRENGAFGFATSIMIGYLTNFILFIPFFVKMKITPSYIFYSKWIILIWVLLLLLVYLSMFVDMKYRIIPFIIILFILFILFRNYFEKRFKIS